MDVKSVNEIMEQRRKVIAEWLEANGIDTSTVPESAAINIINDQITVDTYVRDDDGKVILEGGSPMRRQVTVPLRVAPPGLPKFP